MNDLVKRLRHLAYMLHDDLSVANEAADEIERLQKELAACQKDAERYRWLRSQVRPDDFYSGAPSWEVSYQANGMGQVMRFEKLDAAIDAAISSEKNNGVE